MLRPEFLEEAGWDSEQRFLAPPREHPLLGLRKCIVVDCLAGVFNLRVDFCLTCHRRYNDQGCPPLEEFAATVSGKRNVGEQVCAAPGCERPKHYREGLCYAHSQHRRKQPELTLATWLATSPKAAPYPSFGDCTVASCIRLAANNTGFCQPHQLRWLKHHRRNPEAHRGAWAAATDPVAMDYIMVLKGLPERFQIEFLLALQARTDSGVRTQLTILRAITAMARRQQVESLFDLELEGSVRQRRDVGQLMRGFCRDVRRLTSTPETERAKDIWDLGVLGFAGIMDFTVISQGWLRTAAKHWATEDMPNRRGRRPASTAQAVVKHLGILSEILHLSREDHGEVPSALGRKDIVNVLNRLAYQEHTGKISNGTRINTVRHVRKFLEDVRPLGLTLPGREMEGLPLDFSLKYTDIPRKPQVEKQGKDLPVPVMQCLSANLHLLEERSGIGDRRIVEILMDTGRRPDEITRLPWDCLERDAGGDPVLVYTDFKNNRIGRRLPIAEDTAAVILKQKEHIRERFPDTPLEKLALFPRDQRNRQGTKPTASATLTHSHRIWVDSFAEHLVDEDGQPFDPALVFPYAYRHSYAQRHADNGVTPDVLRDLMGHKSMETTLSYYRVTEQRIRGAVDQVARHQFDGHGERVFRGVATLLADEHARMRVGQVAVPFGICTEPSNVKAGGQACPYKFTCLGCGHFRSDASYLPELKSYLQQLLADRERLRAAKDIDDWARDHLMPPDEEVDQLRRLIRRVEQDLDDLTEDERQAITDAVSVIRKARQTVSLGMPSIKTLAAKGK